MRLFIVIFILFFGLAGCATVDSKTSPSVSSIKAKLDEANLSIKQKDEQIRLLEAKLEKDEMAVPALGESGKLSFKQIQTALKNANFYEGPIDGKIGKGTRQAIRAFQEANGLAVDGIVGKETASKLRLYLE